MMSEHVRALRKAHAPDEIERDNQDFSENGAVATTRARLCQPADVFANHSLFRSYWPKMLKSFALEAVGTTSDRSKQASKTEAEAFLARVQGDSTESRDAAYRLAENQSSAHASFELEDVRKTPTLIHFNRVAKQ